MRAPAPVLHASAWFPPEQVGGTEIYLQGLVAALSRLGRAGRVIVPRAADDLAAYSFAGIEVSPYPRLGDVGPAAQAQSLSALFEANAGAIYHQHAWTPDCGAEQLRLAREKGLRTVLTVHLASAVCLRGTMMRFGRVPCSGDVSAEPCAACWAQGRGLPRPLAEALALWPFGGAMAPSRLRTALNARQIAAQRRQDLSEMTGRAEVLVAVCQWLHAALAANGARPDQLRLSRQGVSAEFVTAPARVRAPDALPRRLLYIGRWDALKGVDLVVSALAAEPDLPLQLAIHAIAGDADGEEYRARVEAIAGGDPRISIHPPAGRNALPGLMADSDALVIPSVTMETGPLVALEAQSVGLYILGADIGGVAELVDDEAKGRLVAAGDFEAWRGALRAFAREGPPAAVPRRVRTMDDVARDMADLYATLD
jgi:glycosyltransferase involved in cell wall biosynthesis